MGRRSRPHACGQARPPARQLIDVLRPSPFDDDAGALDVAEVTQARPQPLTCGTLEGKAEKPDARRFRPLLRSRRERPRGSAAEQRDELAPAAHSITSSAVESSVCGTSRPSVLAVLRLRANSNFTGACTGKSAAFSPRRIRST